MARATTRKRKRALPRGESLLAQRTKRAEEMAGSTTVTVTLRIPSEFNEWLDAYRHLSYPQRVGKQELVVEGLTMAYVRRGMPGEAVLEAPTVLTRRRPHQ
jgi:hypothetical protein